MKILSYICTLLFLVVGIINFAPIMGVAGQARLEALYAIDIASPDTLLLMRHRAVLFGIVGGYIIAAAFKPAIRTSATIMGMTSMLSFIWLYPSQDTTNAALGRIVTIDIIAVLLLVVAYALHLFQARGQQSLT